MLSVMKCFEIWMQGCLLSVNTGFTLQESSPSTFLHPLLFKFLFYCYSFYIIKVLLRLPNTYSFLYRTSFDRC